MLTLRDDGALSLRLNVLSQSATRVSNHSEKLTVRAGEKGGGIADQLTGCATLM